MGRVPGVRTSRLRRMALDGVGWHSIASDGLQVPPSASETLDSTGLSPQVPYDVAKSKEVRNAFRRHLAAAPEQWDWGKAHVPSALTEEAEAEREEKEKAKAKEKKKKAEKARKERRKAEEGVRNEALARLGEATQGEAVEALQAALQHALTLVGDDDGSDASSGEAAQVVDAARKRLAELTDPEWQKRRERARRAEAAERRLGGLTAAQAAFLNKGA